MFIYDSMTLGVGIFAIAFSIAFFTTELAIALIATIREWRRDSKLRKRGGK